MVRIGTFHSFRFLVPVLLIIGSIGIACGDVAQTGEETGTITFHGLFPATGQMSVHGESAKSAFELAVSDINTILANIGSPLTVKGIPHEIGSDPDSALEAITALHDEGVTLVMAALSSAQADAVRGYADENGVLILATGTSAIPLAIPDDNLLRFSPDDTHEAIATAKVFTENGITRIVPLFRDDLWGNGLYQEVKTALPQTVTMEEGVRYEPNETSYADVLGDLDEQVGEILKTTDPKAVTIYALTWNELEDILKEASGGYPNLAAVSWMGCDGNVLLPALFESTDAASYAFDRNFTGLSANRDNPTEESAVYRALKERLGIEPDGGAYGGYDAVWIAFEALRLGGRQDADSLRDAVIAISNRYYGEAGESAKNEAGDMIEGHYILIGLDRENDTYAMKNRATVELYGMDDENVIISMYPLEA